MSAEAAPDLEFATPDEQTAIADIRARLDVELKNLEAQGLNFPHVCGDIFFTRCLRGNHGDRDETVKWYRTFMNMRKQFGLDKIHKELEDKKTPWKVSEMPHHKEVLPYFNTVFDQENLRTGTGHLIWYDAVGDWRTERMLEKINPDIFVKFMHTLCERRTAVLDDLSREKGRMVKIVKIMDLEGAGLWMINKAYSKLEAEKIHPVLMGSSIETLHLLFIINFPSAFMYVYRMMSRVLPERLTKRIRILGFDYMKDREFIETVGPSMIETLLAHNKTHAENAEKGGEADDDFALEGKSRVIPASSVMERNVELQAGEKLKWSFRMANVGETAENRSVLGKMATYASSMIAGTDIEFGVNAIWTDMDSIDLMKLPVKVRSVGGTEGTAEFWIDNKPVVFETGLGINVVAANPGTKEVLWTKVYDTFGDQDGASRALMADIEALPQGMLFMLAVKGTGAEMLIPDTWETLKFVGGAATSGSRHTGYALMGCKGGSKGGLPLGEKQGLDVMLNSNAPIQELGLELVAPKMADANMPAQTGSIGPFERPGLITLQWSNYKSILTRRMLAEFKVKKE